MDILLNFCDSHGFIKMIKLESGEVWRLKGECNRCGQCCEEMKMFIPEFSTPEGGCNKLSYENVNGERKAVCAISWCKPAGCIMYPRDPYDKLPEKCSYEWEKISG